MDVVSPDLNSILPDEIMDTEAMAMEEDPPAETAPSSHSAPESAQVPMETEVPEIVSLCPAATPTQKTDALTTLTATDSTLCSISVGTQLIVTSSSSAGSKMATGTAIMTTTQPSSPSVSQNVTKLTAPFTPTSPANHQLIINKVATDGKSPGTTVLKQEGQKLLVTGLSKTGQPIVLAMPNTWSKPATSQGTGGDVKPQLTQFKVVSAGTKPVIGVQAVSSANQLLGSSSPLQAQQLKTVQVGQPGAAVDCL